MAAAGASGALLRQRFSPEIDGISPQAVREAPPAARFASRQREKGCMGWRNKRRGVDRRDGYGFIVQASTALVGPLEKTEGEEMTLEAKPELLACPVCFEPLVRTGISGLNQRAIMRSGFRCPSCKKGYSSRNTYLDLTVTAGAKVYSEGVESKTELFRSPFLSFLYERGWRQNFQAAGFPGPEEEIRMANEFLRPAFGGVLLDVSCGSGLFSRRFASLDLFSAVVAIDFSESMLREAFEYIRRDAALHDKPIALVRADVGRMPFASGSVDAGFAGAALHCWPSPASAMAEMFRILRPGGVFVGTTFLRTITQVASARVLPFLGPFGSQLTALRYLDEAELKDLVRICGLVDYESIVRGGFIMLTARKPV